MERRKIDATIYPEPHVVRVESILPLRRRFGRTSAQSPDRAAGLRNNPRRLLWNCGCRAVLGEAEAALWWPCSYHPSTSSG
jgi:hypothetical protein